jgi:hypothetical protein
MIGCSFLHINRCGLIYSKFYLAAILSNIHFATLSRLRSGWLLVE